MCATPLNAARRTMTVDTLSTLTDAVRRYQHESPMLTRALLDLAGYWLRLGRWRTARLHLESALAVCDRSKTKPAFLAAIQRQLGLILVRMGEEAAGKRLLHMATRAGDLAGKREWLRLAIDAREFEQAKLLARELEAIPYFQLEGQAWRAEILARQNDAHAAEWATLTLLTALDGDSEISIALTRRALGMVVKEYKEARQSFEQAIEFFRRANEPYEVAQTLYESGRVSLRFGDTHHARLALGEAAGRFLQMGAVTAYQKTWEFLKSVPVDGDEKLPEAGATHTGVALLWVELSGAWTDATRTSLLEVAVRQGGITEPLGEGLFVLFNTESRNAEMVVETALAFYEILKPLSEQSQRERQKKPLTFRIAAATGMLPYEAHELAQGIETVTRAGFFKHAQQQLSQAPLNTVLVDDPIYLETEAHYEYGLMPYQNGLRWWTLVTPYQHIKSRILPNRSTLEADYQVVMEAVDGVVTRFISQQQGGLVMLEGLAGSGKTRILDILRAEIRSSVPAMLLQMRGTVETRYEPFGVLRDWLGSDIHVQIIDPQERQRAYITAFHMSLTALLRTRPVLMVIDDVHLMDSATLQALRAILPLMSHYPLMVVMTARPEGNVRWQKLVQRVQRALPERSVRVSLPTRHAPAREAELEALDLTARWILDCAAVLGREFSVRVLRRMAGVPNLAHSLVELAQQNYLEPTDEALVWRFVHSNEWENFYRQLDAPYTQLLHSYAWSALNAMHSPADTHAHLARLHDIARPALLKKLAQVRSFDAPEEALIYYDAALDHHPSEVVRLNLMLGRAEVLLRLGQAEEAEKTLRAINRQQSLTEEQRVRLMLFEGELLSQIGQIPALLKIYSNAMMLLRSDVPSVNNINLQVDVLYAQAMAHFRHGDIEVAKSLLGMAIFKAGDAGLTYQLPRLWQFLARLHQGRGQFQQAWKAASRALEVQEKLDYKFITAESYLLAGNLQEMLGNLKKARDYYLKALSRFEDVGNVESILHVRLRLALVAMYEGQFDALIEQLETALQIAPFAEMVMLRVQIHSTYAEGLALKGDLVRAFQQANSGLELAKQLGDTLSLSEGYLALAKAARTARWWTAARDAVEHAIHLLPKHAYGLLRLRAYVMLMEILLGNGQIEAFVRVYNLTRDIGETPGDDLTRARLHLLVGRYRMSQENWNMAAVEVEKAYRRLKNMGATYWLEEARELLREINERFTSEVS